MQENVVPPSAVDFAVEGAFAGIGTDDVADEAAKEHKLERSIAFANA